MLDILQNYIKKKKLYDRSSIGYYKLRDRYHKLKNKHQVLLKTFKITTINLTQ